MLMFMYSMLFFLSVMFIVLVEWALLSSMQIWWGPVVVSIFSMLQCLMDSVKLLMKNITLLFYSYLLLMMSLYYSLNIDNMYNFLLITSLMYFIYIILMNMTMYMIMTLFWLNLFIIYYDITFMLVLLLCFYKMNYYLFVIMFSIMLLELGWTPFKLENESELVCGNTIEMSSIMFTMLFLFEYTCMIVMMMLLSLLSYKIMYSSILIIMTIMLLTFIMTSKNTQMQMKQSINSLFSAIICISLFYNLLYHECNECMPNNESMTKNENHNNLNSNPEMTMTWSLIQKTWTLIFIMNVVKLLIPTSPVMTLDFDSFPLDFDTFPQKSEIMMEIMNVLNNNNNFDFTDSDYSECSEPFSDWEMCELCSLMHSFFNECKAF